MSQLSPAAEPFSNLAGSVLIGAALSETTSHFVCVVECFFKMRDYQVEHDLEAVETVSLKDRKLTLDQTGWQDLGRTPSEAIRDNVTG